MHDITFVMFIKAFSVKRLKLNFALIPFVSTIYIYKLNTFYTKLQRINYITGIINKGICQNSTTTDKSENSKVYMGNKNLLEVT